MGALADEAFDALDRNRDGVISRSEFNVAMTTPALPPTMPATGGWCPLPTVTLPPTGEVAAPTNGGFCPPPGHMWPPGFHAGMPTVPSPMPMPWPGPTNGGFSPMPPLFVPGLGGPMPSLPPPMLHAPQPIPFQPQQMPTAQFQPAPVEESSEANDIARNAAFRAMDRNHDGLISRSEFGAALGPPQAEPDLTDPATGQPMVHVPRVHVVERLVHVPQHHVRDVHVPGPVQIQYVDKFVKRPYHVPGEPEDVFVHVPEIREQIVEIPQPVPVVEVVKHVPVPTLQERHVHVPQVEYRDRIVEVPEPVHIPWKRVVHVPQVQVVTRHVPKYEMATVPAPTEEQLRDLPTYPGALLPVRQQPPSPLGTSGPRTVLRDGEEAGDESGLLR